jgi:hypothetical protein
MHNALSDRGRTYVEDEVEVRPHNLIYADAVRLMVRALHAR